MSGQNSWPQPAIGIWICTWIVCPDGLAIALNLKRKLQAERIGILIDSLESALDSAGKFIEAHRRYVELLPVLSDPTVQSITLITGCARKSVPTNSEILTGTIIS